MGYILVFSWRAPSAAENIKTLKVINPSLRISHYIARLLLLVLFSPCKIRHTSVAKATLAKEVDEKRQEKVLLSVLEVVAASNRPFPHAPRGSTNQHGMNI